MVLVRCKIYFPDSRLPQKSVEHLLRAMNSVLSWHISCRHVFRKAARFQQKTIIKWGLSQFRYCNQALVPCKFDIDTVLPLLQTWQGPSSNPYGTEEAKVIISRTGEAKVHAEAALMHWIATVKVRSLSFINSFCFYVHIPTVGCWL